MSQPAVPEAAAPPEDAKAAKAEAEAKAGGGGGDQNRRGIGTYRNYHRGASERVALAIEDSSDRCASAEMFRDISRH